MAEELEQRLNSHAAAGPLAAKVADIVTLQPRNHHRPANRPLSTLAPGARLSSSSARTSRGEGCVAELRQADVDVETGYPPVPLRGLARRP